MPKQVLVPVISPDYATSDGSAAVRASAAESRAARRVLASATMDNAINERANTAIRQLFSLAVSDVFAS